VSVIHACAGVHCQVCAIANNPTSPRALARSGSPITSKMSASDLPVTDLEVLVYEAIRDSGEEGMTQDDLLERFPNLSYSSVTARPAALKRKGMILDSGRKRPGRSGRLQVVLIDAAHSQGTLL
jgi:hypothetical protein